MKISRLQYSGVVSSHLDPPTQRGGRLKNSIIPLPLKHTDEKVWKIKLVFITLKYEVSNAMEMEFLYINFIVGKVRKNSANSRCYFCSSVR